MKVLFVGLTGFIFFLSTHAHAIETQSYLQLQKEFKNASPATTLQVLGFWSGRCFDILSPTLELNGVLIFEHSPSQPSGHEISNPGVLNADYLSIISHQDSQGRSLPANYGDTYDWRHDPTVYWPIESLWDSDLHPVEVKGTVTWGTNYVSNSVRLSADGLIVETVNLYEGQMIMSSSLGRFERMKSGPISYCRFSTRL